MLLRLKIGTNFETVSDLEREAHGLHDNNKQHCIATGWQTPLNVFWCPIFQILIIASYFFKSLFQNWLNF